MCRYFYAILLLAFTGCHAQKNTWIGTVERTEVEKNFSWFTDTYASYNPDSNAIEVLRKELPAYTIFVFGGTWCGDTQELLPAFYKTTDKAGLSRESIQLYLVDQQKKSPEGLEKKYKIEAVPVFILYRDGKEFGRIVESVENSIEKDLVQLIRKK